MFAADCIRSRSNNRQVVTVDQVDVFDDAGTALKVSNHRSLIKHCHELTAMNSNMNSNAMLINLRFFHHALQHSATHCSTLQHAADLRERPRHAQTVHAHNCRSLQHTATHCNMLQCNATHRTTRQLNASDSGMGWLRLVGSLKLWVSFAEYSLFYRALLPRSHPIYNRLRVHIAATHMNPPHTIQLTATHRSTLQHAAMRGNAIQLEHTATRCNALQHTANRCNSMRATSACKNRSTFTPLQHTATHCNTLQHTATHCNTL